MDMYNDLMLKRGMFHYKLELAESEGREIYIAKYSRITYYVEESRCCAYSRSEGAYTPMFNIVYNSL